MSDCRRPLALALVAGALLASGCGSDEEGDPIPAGSVQEIERQLDTISSRLANPTPDECQAVEGESFPALQSAVDSLPDGVDADVRDALEESLARLQDLVSQTCSDLEPETETETAPPPETETTPPETETTPETETEAPPETETTPPPNTNTQPDDGTGGAEGGSGQGGGTAGPGEGDG